MPLLSTHANLPAVVSIIALSGSILLPSLRAARAQSGPAASLAILAGVSNGIRTYTDPDVGNAGFEDGACNAPPPEWRWFHTTNPGAGGYALTRCVGGVPEGAKAVQLLRNDPAGDSALDKDTPALRFPVSAGRIYNLDYAARIAGPATNHSAALQWHAAAADGNLVSNSTANVPDAQTSWEYFGLSARAPAVAQGDTADASHAAIRFAINGTGNIYLDDVDMRDVTYNQNRILNGGFENSPNTTPRPVTWTVINTPFSSNNTTQVSDSSQAPIYAGSYVLLMHRGSTSGGNDFALRSAPIAVNHGEEIQVNLAGRRATSVGGSTLALRLTVNEFDNGAPVGTPQTTLVGPFSWPTSQYAVASASFTVGASADSVALTIRVVTPGDAPSVHDIYLDGISIIVPANDCNANGDDDANDVANGVSLDCNSNGVPDECDASFGTSTDCQPNGIPDECETDCNNNGLPDFCDINYSTSADCQLNGIPDECEADCDADGTPDDCELDCDLNGTPDDCEPIPDCNSNGRSDVCDVGWGISPDLNTNGIPDECELDCNSNGTSDDYDIAAGTSNDCDSNGIPDECEGGGSSIGVTVSTDKDCYAPGEHVTITVTNNTCSLINIRDLGRWEIRDASNNRVFRPACTLLQIITLHPGESYTFTLGGGGSEGTTWDQLDEGDGQVGCGYSNRAQVPNGTYQACTFYTNANYDPDSTVCATFKIANNCVGVGPDCPCNMPGGPIRIGITNGSTQPIGLPHQQAWRIRSLAGTVVFAPPPSGPPAQLDPGQSHHVYWDQNDSQGQPASSGSYSVEFDYIEMPDLPRLARGRLQLGGCLQLILDQDCYAPGALIKAKVVNRSCQPLRLTLCDVGPIQIFDDQDVPVWSYPCDIACDDSRIMQPGEMRMWTWNQTDDGDGTNSNCESWNNAQQVPNGRYCAQIPYADVNLQRGFTAQQCFDIGGDCADLAADEDCYEVGQNVCVTLTNDTGGDITVDRIWHVLDGAGNQVAPDPGCFIAWLPPVIADGGSQQFCWIPLGGCLPLGAAGSYTFDVHFGEADGAEHTYRQDFTLVDVGQCPARACCYPDGACANLSSGACAAAGGHAGEAGSACLGDADSNGIDDYCQDDSCGECGPGAHFIDAPPCPAGDDVISTEALAGMDTDFDCVADNNIRLSGPVTIRRTAPLDASANFPGSGVVDGHRDVIDTEIIAMSLSGGGVTLAAGAGRGAIALAASKGTIVEQAADTSLADSLFDVFFEVDMGDGTRLYNQAALRVQSTISCLPPDANYVHPGECIPLYSSPVVGQGVLVGNLVTAVHDTFPTSDDFTFCDDFEDGNIADWRTTTAGNGTIGPSNAVAQAGAWSLHMNSPNQGDRADAVTPAVVGNRLDFNQPYTVEFDFRLPHLNYHFFEVLSVNKGAALGNSQVYLVMDTPGGGLDLIYRDPTGNHSIAALNANQWYHFEVDVRPADGVYDVLIDNGATASVLNIPFAGVAGSSGYTGARVGDRNNDAGEFFDKGEAYWDNVCIYGKLRPLGHCGDLNADGFIDLNDYALWEACLAGPGVTLSPSCEAADLDDDLDVDLVDYALLAERFNAYAGFPPDCVPNAPFVRADPVCYTAGDTATVSVDVPPIPAGSIRFLVVEDPESGAGAILQEETRPLTGAPTYTLEATLPQAGMYGVVAHLLDTGGQVVGSDGLGLGARPPLAQVPPEVCTFEVFTVSASSLRAQAENAAASQTPMPLPIGSRSFIVTLEHHEDLVAPEVFTQIPTLGLFRGQIVGRPGSEVRLTFAEGLVHGTVDQGDEEPSILLEPAYPWDQGLPFDLYVGYVSSDVRIPLEEHGEPPPDEPGREWPAGSSPVSSPETDAEGPRLHDCPANTRRINVNLYWDNDPFNTRVAEFNNMDATFKKARNVSPGGLGVGLYMHGSFRINTNNYRDGHVSPGLLDDFTNDPNTTHAGVDVAMLFTDNGWNIGNCAWVGLEYRCTLGRAWWTPGALVAPPRCWVWGVGASAWQKRIVGCQELSHNLGASNRCNGTSIPTVGSCSHRNTKTKTHRHCVGAICWDHLHYSIMRTPFAGDDAADDKWLDKDQDTLTQVLGTAGHFCN